MSKGSTVSVSIPVLPTLGLLFIILKLTNAVDWSWHLVLAPLYAMAAIYASIILLVIAVLAVVAITAKR